jgi:hypothetical protein
VKEAAMSMSAHDQPPDTDIDDADLDDALSAIEDAALTWDEAGLLLPPVPREVSGSLRKHDEMDFGTDATDPSDRAGWLERARDPATPPLVAMGHMGHGVNSYNLCYQLIAGPLAVFVRQPFGGAYAADLDEQRNRFNAIVELLEELVVQADAARDGGRLKDGWRLIVAIDGRGATGWELSPIVAWRDTEHPIEDVLRVLGQGS